MASSLPNSPFGKTFTLANGVSLTPTSGNSVNFATSGQVAISLTIDGSQTTGPLTCQLNSTTGAQFPINAGVSYGFGWRALEVNQIAFANSSGASQTVSILCGTVNNS